MAKFLISREPAFELFKVQSIQVDLLRVYKVTRDRHHFSTKSHRGDETITYRHNCQCILSLSLSLSHSVEIKNDDSHHGRARYFLSRWWNLFLNFRPTIVQPLQSCCMLVAKDIYPYSRLTIFRSILFFDEINY